MRAREQVMVGGNCCCCVDVIDGGKGEMAVAQRLHVIWPSTIPQQD